MGKSVATTSQPGESAQLALSLFEELAEQNRSITESPKDIAFRRNRLFMDISECGLLASKAIDVAFYLVAQDPGVQECYSYDLNFFKWMLNYDSNNHGHLRRVLKEAQKATIEGDASTPDYEHWGSKTVLNTVVIKGGHFMFQVDPVIQRLIKDPAQSHVFSLRITNSFTSVYAKRLYPRLLDCLEEGTTGWVSLAVVRDWLGCNTKFYHDFYEFRRGPLDVATTQINQHSNLEVEVKTKNIPGSKAIGSLRFDFKVSGNWQPKQETMAWTQELYETLRQEMGLSQGDFDSIRANREQYTDERLRQAIAYTRFMAKKSNIANIPRYFMTTLENEYRVPGLALEIEAEKAKQLTASAEAASRKDVARERSSSSTLKASQTEGTLGLQAFALIVEDEQRSLFGAFTKTPMFQVVAQATGIPAGELTLEATMNNATASEAFGMYVYQWAKKAKSPARKSAVKDKK